MTQTIGSTLDESITIKKTFNYTDIYSQNLDKLFF